MTVMLGFPTYRFVPVLLVICACPLGPAPGEQFDTDTTSATGSEQVTSGDSGDGDPTTMGPGGPDPSPTTTATTGESSAGSGGGDVSTTLDPPAGCGPCVGNWDHDGSVLLNSMTAHIDYSCVRTIDGGLFIHADADPAQIASLANLQRVTGELTILGHSDLTDLDSFGCLREVGELKLEQMPQLTDLGGLARLEAAPHILFDGLGITALPEFAAGFAGITSLTLRNNHALVDLHAASSWGPGGGGLDLRIAGNAALPGLTGLAGLLADHGAALVNIELADLPSLTSLAGLEPVVFANLYAERLPLVPDLAPLSNLAIGGQITFNAMHEVTTLTGLGALTSVGTFTLGDCSHDGSGGMDGLTSLAGLDSLESVNHFALADNDKLVSLAGAPALTSMQGFAAVGNPGLTQEDVDALFKQIGGEPPLACHGGWDRCECAPINPG